MITDYINWELVCYFDFSAVELILRKKRLGWSEFVRKSSIT